MGYGEVEFLAMRREIRVEDLHDTFALRQDRPLVWLQKLCFAVLRRLRAYEISRTEEIVRYPINGRSFMERLLTQRRELSRELGIAPRTLLIGGEDYEELMCAPEVRHAFQFNAPYCRDISVYGLTVKVIPWMRGMLVMP